MAKPEKTRRADIGFPEVFEPLKARIYGLLIYPAPLRKRIIFSSFAMLSWYSRKCMVLTAMLWLWTSEIFLSKITCTSVSGTIAAANIGTALKHYVILWVRSTLWVQRTIVCEGSFSSSSVCTTCANHRKSWSLSWRLLLWRQAIYRVCNVGGDGNLLLEFLPRVVHWKFRLHVVVVLSSRLCGGNR